ncbi:MAG: Various polyols ABC transporter, permease component 2 [Chloroflexi bacterium AL-W]|nr:Various polyols ABC transporter, permease component 2 [Chloroflexi bacterium AL-N1]NOK69404.1 Various polyols ABC transporter, permease component 2 [Chloroflexi bacterium AL-N10]NOK76465.1 Various polyols ABC transporter, permease component 2 [Chloroflexi bacterium AL-N5]NOK83582.1 Various polyols ABC transporter, permease component 2 [Chloroflexi bacterium AL-W]NOK91242.1 Various polyols ABC transporter, permease component 2 [Chloroflexi bacterium AL-N15]
MAIQQTASAPRPTARNAIRWRHMVTERLLDLLLAFLIFLMIAPIIFLIVSSFKTSNEFVSSTGAFFPAEWQFSNYPELWRQANFGTYFWNSMIICTITTIIATAFASLTGYALSRFRFPGADAYGLGVLGTQLIPGTLFFIPLYLSFVWVRNNLGIPLIGTNMGGIILYVGFYIPISLWLLRGFFAAIPVDLEEQAMVDGATRFRAFWQIVLPLAMPGIVSAGIYIFLTAWDELFFASVLQIRTIPFGLLLFSGVQSAQSRYELICAGAVLAILPIMVLFLLLQRRLVEGLTAGAVK